MFIFATGYHAAFSPKAVDQLTSFNLLIIIALDRLWEIPFFIRTLLFCGQCLQLGLFTLPDREGDV
jgi:hypothetical protein